MKLISLCLCFLFASKCWSFETACTRPVPGSYLGSCDARKGIEVEKSAHSMHKWITCMQEERGWGTGGTSDAIFFSELIPEWEVEINAQLSVLDTLLSPKDKKALHKEQQAWERARAREIAKKARQPSRDGSMYRVFESIDSLDLPERRALELGCRVEKLIRNRSEQPTSSEHPLNIPDEMDASPQSGSRPSP